MRTTELRKPPVRRVGRRKGKKQQGFALLLSLIAIAVLAILVTDLHETTGMSFTAAMAERDQLRAEYLAKSGLNLTRMLIGQEKNLRAVAGPILSLMLNGRPPPQIPVWRFADMLLKPFANFNASKDDVRESGIDVDRAEGLGNVHGTFSIEATAENGKININDPRLQDLQSSQLTVASLFYSLLGGYQPSPQKYDPLFSKMDAKGRLTTRVDVINNVIDWWDQDTAKANFDPVSNLMQPGGAEDVDFYRDQPEPYAIRNAPLDTLEELRLVNGVTDDLWATFIEPDAEDPSTRQITIYGQTRVNPNEAAPGVMLARVCSFPEARQQPLCADQTGLEPMKFMNVIAMVRVFTQGAIPIFSRGSDFVNFITGQGDVYKMLSSFGGGGSTGGGGLLSGGGAGASATIFTPLKLTDQNALTEMRKLFSTSGSIFTIEVTGHSGISQRHIRAVINTDANWTPPKPNAGRLPPLGIFAYYRID